MREGRSVIEGVTVTARSLLVRSTRSAVSRLDHYDLHGGEHRDVPLPGKATVTSLDGSDDRDEAWVALTSFARPPRLHRWTPEHLDPWGADDPTIDPDAYVVEQVRYPSTDGTDVGLLTLRRADTVTGPDTPTILTGYGGFAITMSPEYNAVAVAHCDAGGLWAVAGPAGRIRGGRGLAPRRHARQQAAGVRRLRGRSRLAGRRRAHLARAAGDPRRQQRRAAGGHRP